MDLASAGGAGAGEDAGRAKIWIVGKEELVLQWAGSRDRTSVRRGRISASSHVVGPKCLDGFASWRCSILGHR